MPKGYLHTSDRLAARKAKEAKEAKEIYIAIAELEMIKEALEARRNQCTAEKANHYKQLIFKLNKLQPKFGLQIISDPSERETAS